ncbi:hypothetical protein PMZ80_005068 [Knufia obscura]|uniref:Uncharacterized protein n=1 Tax=Knufia obscura TaxID=1635080 RepID=A0ABR0RQJ2_9EURO|nr:hypothetical protein PMZ80_005068 [Knufia obscura]
MAAIVPALEIQAPTGGAMPPERLPSMSRTRIGRLADSRTVQLLIENDQGELESFGFDAISEALVCAGSPLINVAFARLPAGEVRDRVVLPGSDTQSYTYIFNHLQAQLDARRQLDLPIIENEPIMAHVRIGEAALNLGMSSVFDTLNIRTMQEILNPDLHTSYLQVSATEFENVVTTFLSHHDLHVQIIDAVGRAMACQRLEDQHLAGIRRVLEENQIIRDEVREAEGRWIRKGQAGEDIYKAQ